MSRGHPPRSARKLVALQGMPVLIFAVEASYHALYDDCTARCLAPAGVKTDYVRLEKIGTRGNGHMVRIEMNNLEIAAVIARWQGTNVH